MKKRSKLIATIVASVMCLGLIVYGVYALTTVSFALNSSFSFDANGVYVGVSGQVYTGATSTDLEPLTTDDSYTLNEVKNFTAKEDGTPDGTKSQETIAAWEPANVTLDEIKPYLLYEVKFKNYAPYDIMIIPTNNTASVEGATITESKDDITIIASGEIGTYKLMVEITKFLEDIEQTTVNISFAMEKIVSNEKFFDFNETIGRITGLNTETYTAETAPETLVIPATINGVEVKSLATKGYGVGTPTFNFSDKTKNIIIQAKIDSIPNSGFYGCSSLVSVILPSSLKNIGQFAFGGCTSLTTITIPNGLTDIMGGAFNGCTSLVSIAIPSSVTNINISAFASCGSLMTTVDSSNPNYSSLDGSLYNKDKTELIRGASKAVVNIPNSVTTIYGNAFNGCELLTSITIPGSVTTLGYGTFYGCTSLKYIKMSGNTLSSTYSLPTTSSKVWVTSTSANKPANWTENVVTEIPTSADDLYYHQQAAWEK